MFHAINQQLARLRRQILEIGLARDNAIAAAHGWQARQVKPGTWSYRDPRFDQLATGNVPRLVNLVEDLLDQGFEVTIADGNGALRTWTGAALVERISQVPLDNTADDRRRWS